MVKEKSRRKRRKPHRVEREEGVSVRHFYGDDLIAEDVVVVGEDIKGRTYTRTEFRVRVGGARLADILEEEMPMRTKLHLEDNHPGVVKAMIFLGFNEGDYIGEGELMEYVLNELGCRSMAELRKKDLRAYELVQNKVPDAEKAFREEARR